MKWHLLDLSQIVCPSVARCASVIGGRATVVLAQPSCQLLRHRWWAPAATLLSGGRIIAGTRSRTDASRSTSACARVPLRPACHPEDDTISGSTSGDWAGCDFSTDAGMPALHQPPPGRDRDPRRAVAQLDGGVANKLSDMWNTDGGCPAAQSVDEGGSGRSFLKRVATHGRQGELTMTRAIRMGSPTYIPLAALMRSLLLPRASRSWKAWLAGEMPRLLDTVVPGFDHFLHQSNPGFRRPGTLLLPVSIRIPVLAGIAQVTDRPDQWAPRISGMLQAADGHVSRVDIQPKTSAAE
jgi:hypothetical protein